MTQKITFTACGDYLIPDIQLAPHLIEVDTTARARIERIIQGLLEVNPVPDKTTMQMEWVQ